MNLKPRKKFLLPICDGCDPSIISLGSHFFWCFNFLLILIGGGCSSSAILCLIFLFSCIFLIKGDWFCHMFLSNQYSYFSLLTLVPFSSNQRYTVQLYCFFFFFFGGVLIVCSVFWFDFLIFFFSSILVLLTVLGF
jgi:hypothetical protein